MRRTAIIFIILSLMIRLDSYAQLQLRATIPGYTFHPRSEDKPSWQRLNIWMGGTFLVVIKEGQVDLDSCMNAAARSMGISMFALIGEDLEINNESKQIEWIDTHDPKKGIQLAAETEGAQQIKQWILLGGYYAFQPNSYQRYLDSVEYFLGKAVNLSNSLKNEKLGRQALCLLGKVYAQGLDKKADSIFTLLLNQCQLSGDKQTQARALMYRSKFTPPRVFTLEAKVNDATKAAEIYHSIGKPEEESHMLTDLGYLQVITMKMSDAYNSMINAYKLAESTGFPYLHYNTQAIASITIFQGKFGEPLGYVLQTINSAEVTRDSFTISYMYTSMSDILKSEGRLDESYVWEMKALKRFVADRNPSVYALTHSITNYMSINRQDKEALKLVTDIISTVGKPTTFTELFFLHQSLANCYLNLGMPDIAEKHIQTMDSLETLAEVIRGPIRRSMVYSAYGRLYYNRDKYELARDFFNRSLNFVSIADGTLNNVLSAYRTLIEIDSILGDNEAAVGHYKRYTQLLDSNFKITKIRQAEELQVMYNINEKENQITSLTQLTELQKANSEKAALVRNIIIAGIITVFIVAILLYRQNRLRQRNNKLITQKNEQLQQLVEDKEWLLKEVHHRVKNNLQIVISLLDSQSEYIDNDAALDAIEDNMRRVHAMALIHQKLYLSDEVSTIFMPEYINELVQYAHDSFDTGSRIIFEQEIAPLDLDVSQAIPLGLVINESIVNAIKYAFPGKRKGTVSISLSGDEDDNITVEISDNGTGLPDGFERKAHTSLGFDLMHGLTRQLNGSFNMENRNGLHILIKFTALGKKLSQVAVDHKD